MFWRKPARQLPGRPAEQPAGLTSTLTCTEPNSQSVCSIQCVPSACSKRALLCRFPCHQHQGTVARSGLGQEKDPHFLSSPNLPQNCSDPLADASKWCGWVWKRVSFSFLKKGLRERTWVCGALATKSTLFLALGRKEPKIYANTEWAWMSTKELFKRYKSLGQWRAVKHKMENKIINPIWILVAPFFTGNILLSPFKKKKRRRKKEKEATIKVL